MLDVSRNNLTGPRASIFHGLATLFQGLTRCRNLKQLNLIACQLGTEAIAELSTSLRKFNRSLQRLDLALRDLRRGFRKLGITPLNAAQRTNLVEKLHELSESELQKLEKIHVLEDVDVANEVTQQHGSNLRYYSMSANTEPLKRLLWTLETRERELHLQDRAMRKQLQRAGSGMQPDETGDDRRDEYDDDDDESRRAEGEECHRQQCKKLWLAQEELKPKSERRPIPKTPPGLGQMSESEIALSGSGGKVDRDAIEAMNRMAQESFNVHGMEKCENCGRTFAEGRLAIHAKSCHGNNIAKRVGDGAAPRNKKDSEVEYGRTKSDTSGGGGASTSVKKSSSQPRPPSTTASSRSSSTDADSEIASSSSSTGTRALSGSLPSNRKRMPSQEATGASALPPSSAASSRANLHTPLSQSISQEIHVDDLRRELAGTNKPRAIATIQEKLKRWEAATLSTLQEIRDLKELFTQLQS
uniref:Uncharacterized protein n=1 Tax=Globisporangium ultimum (strain ATCC 200006 / CBS 805.95 / DAOM BR144) TaxID=431595 RepID=K3WZ83_GLOUD